MADSPSRDDLLAVAAFANRFNEPGIVAGEWVYPEPSTPGTIMLGMWMSDAAVVEWNQAIYDRCIIDPDSDYLDDANVEFVNRSIADPSLLNDLDLQSLRRVITFLARAERHTEGGWYESAFETGMAQAATRRLGELADSADV